MSVWNPVQLQQYENGNETKMEQKRNANDLFKYARFHTWDSKASETKQNEVKWNSNWAQMEKYKNAVQFSTLFVDF